MPTTIPLVSRPMSPALMRGATANASNLDFVAVAVFAITGLLLTLAFASLLPVSADVAFFMASVS